MCSSIPSRYSGTNMTHDEGLPLKIEYSLNKNNIFAISSLVYYTLKCKCVRLRLELDMNYVRHCFIVPVRWF